MFVERDRGREIEEEGSIRAKVRWRRATERWRRTTEKMEKRTLGARETAKKRCNKRKAA